MKPGLRILCADDDALLAEVMLLLFRRAGYVAESVSNGAEAWERLKCASFDVVVTDHRMPGGDGPALVQRLNAAHFAGRIVVHSGGLAPAHARFYRALGVDALLAKPARPEQLLAVVEKRPPSEPIGP